MSAACLPPIQPSISTAQRQHPRFAEYQRYRSSMAAQLVTACGFSSWLSQTEERERSFDVVFQVDWSNKPDRYDYPDRLADGWWKQCFAPGHVLIGRYGPFTTEQEAEAA